MDHLNYLKEAQSNIEDIIAKRCIKYRNFT